VIRECRLDNGLALLTETMPDLRSVCAGVWLRRGSRHEAPGISGISHFIEHLVFKGTERRSALQIAREIDAVGGQMDAFTGKEATCFYIRVLDEHLDVALDLLTDIVRHPRLAPEDIENERKVIYEEIRMVEDSPEELLFDMLYAARWEGHPLGRPIQGTHETVAAIDRGVLRGFFCDSYRPNQMILAVAGRLDPDRVESTVREAFADLPATPPAEPLSPPGDRPGVKLREKKEMEQLHLCLGLRGLPQIHPDRYALMVANNLLGGTMSSRLFQKIREERGLAYSVYSSVSSYSDSGFQSIYAATNPSSATEVLQIVGQELGEMKTCPISDDALTESKENLKGHIMLNLESSYSRMSNLARKEIAFGCQFSLEEILAGIDAVTSADIQRIANRTLVREDATLVALGPGNGVHLDLDHLEF
jgi:predicted Zn-dependent peptidase